MRRVLPLPFPEDPLVSGSLDLGAHIRAARTQSGLTLEEAAMSVGVSKQTMHSIETGTGTVSLELVLLAAKALGVALFAQPAQHSDRSKHLLLRDRHES